MCKNDFHWFILILCAAGLICVGTMLFYQNQPLVRGPYMMNSIRFLSSNVFDPFKNQPGDLIAGLTLISKGPIAGIDRSMALDNIDAKFTGTVTVSGTYIYDFSEFSGSEVACFTVTNASELAKIPALVGTSDQNNFFCLRDLAKAKQLFGPNYGSGTTTVLIANYELVSAPAEVTNLADLVSVISKNLLTSGGTLREALKGKSWSEYFSFYNQLPIQDISLVRSLVEAFSYELRERCSIPPSEMLPCDSKTNTMAAGNLSILTDKNWNDGKDHLFYIKFTLEGPSAYYGSFTDNVLRLSEEATKK